MAAILFTACTQDELAEQGTALPDGEYPLQIGSVSITAEASEEPWTRVTEKPDGSGSVFQDEDRIGVRIAGSEETGIYRIKVDDARTAFRSWVCGLFRFGHDHVGAAQETRCGGS